MFIPPELVVRSIYSDPPPARNAIQDNPTLLVSWWCTGFALAIILVRLSGRYIRTEKLFMEDRIMAFSIIPLLARMAFVHLILRWGTNNAITTGLSAEEKYHRELGSKMVLPARIFYAAFIWTAKLTVSEFLKRIYAGVWKRSYQIALQVVRWNLFLTFIGVIIATLAECQPFSHYWQVVPDPGLHCRQGYAQLMTMGVSDVVTDLMLVVFPIPIIALSSMPLKRKVSLILLFALSLILVAITIYRVTATISRSSNQQFRSLLASLEILAAAAVANALVLGSFVRDRGVKKQRFKFGSTSGSSSLDRPSVVRTRPRGVLSWGSDSDLVGDLGIRLGPEFKDVDRRLARPAPAVLPLASPNSHVETPQKSWTFPGREGVEGESDDDDLKITAISSNEPPPSPRDISVLTPRRMSFFDVGGLLGDDAPPGRASSVAGSVPSSATHSATYSLRPLIKSPNVRQRSRRGSHALVDDIGGLPEVHVQPSMPRLRAEAGPSSAVEMYFPT